MNNGFGNLENRSLVPKYTKSEHINKQGSTAKRELTILPKSQLVLQTGDQTRPIGENTSSSPTTKNGDKGITPWYGMVWYGMVWYGMVWYGMVWYGMVWYGMVWYGMVWYGMVWYGMVWYGMVWYGMVWYGMVWYGNFI